MENLYLKLKETGRRVVVWITPFLRRLLRFLALPYCYFYLLNWRECSASRWRVVTDFLYIFFILKYFPDNYGACRLWEKPRRDWTLYYGSSYDPWQRARLRKFVQRRDYEILFEDKEVCLMLCQAVALPTPHTLGIVDSRQDWRRRIAATIEAFDEDSVILKPVTGSAGTGVVLITTRTEGLVVLDGPTTVPLGQYELRGRSIVQAVVKQCESIAAFNSSSVNTIRVLTLLTVDDEVLIIGGSMRFGVGSVCRDNWSAGGIATGVDVSAGKLRPFAYDKPGNRYTQHPSSGITFEGWQIPQWEEIRELVCRAQQAFPFYRMLGFDVAISDEGPVIIEINAFPDLVFQEQTSGPLLADTRVLREFARWDLLINKRQEALLADALSQDSTASRGTGSSIAGKT